MYRKVLSIAKREIGASFSTPFSYVVVAGFLLVSGFFFFSILQQFNTIVYQASILQEPAPSLNEWVVLPYYHSLEIILVFLIPLLTMRLFAEEKRSGTYELLVTSPISSSALLLGKYLGSVAISGIMLACSAIFPLVLIVFSDPEALPVVVGFLGVCLLTLSFLSLSLAISAMTKNQAAAGVSSIVLFLTLYLLYIPVEKFESGLLFVLKYLSPAAHSEMLYKGVIQGADLIYFSSVIIVGLVITRSVLSWEKR